MDRSVDFKLLSVQREQDEIGQWISTETQRTVYGTVMSVSAAEFFSGGQNGYKPELRLTMFAPDYRGERDVILNSIRYTVYRTYHGKNDMMELYLERRRGDGESNSQESGLDSPQGV